MSSYSSGSEASSLPSTPLTHVIAPQYYNSPTSLGSGLREETDEDVFARPRGAPSYGRREMDYSSEDDDDGTSSTSSINNYVIEKVSYSSSYDAHGGVVEIGTNTEARTFFNLVKSYIGSGIIGLPYAFYQGGIIVSIFFLVFLAALCNYAIRLLLDCADELEKKFGSISFGDIGSILYGAKGRWAVDLSIVFTQAGFCCVYIIFIGTNLHSVYSGIPTFAYVFMILPLLILVCWLRSLRYLAFVSLAGQGVMLISLLIIMFFATVSMVENTPTIEAINWKGIPIFFGMAVYTYEGIGLVIPMRRAMITPARYTFVMDVSYMMITVLYVYFGAIGYMGYGDNISEQSITMNLPQESILTPLVQLGLIFAIFATYPIQIFPVIGLAEALLFMPNKGKFFTTNEFSMTWRKNLVRTIIVTTTAVIAISIPFFSLFVSLVGAFGSSILAFILPPLFHLKLFGSSAGKAKVISNWAILIFGIVASFVATTVTIIQLIEAFTEAIESF